MQKSTIALLRCPACASPLSLATEENTEEIETGMLRCAGCAAAYPIERGIARFVPPENYATNFGVQWNLFRETQLDSHSGQPISRNRFTASTGWSEKELGGAIVLDAGCGAGRFAEVALSLGGCVVAVDFSGAIDAARDNLKGKGPIDFIQADINALPFAPESFPFVYCLGVIQHTPDPDRSFQSLARVTARGGRLAVDVYPAGWKNILFAKYWIRPLTRRIDVETSLRIVRRLFPALYALSRLVGRIPVAGHYLRYLIPVANYTGVHPLDERQLREWALLDTFDMWAPAYDRPQTLATVRRWFGEAGFTDIDAFHAGFFVGRGLKPAG
jgi:SAM-dependent methyltransferase